MIATIDEPRETLMWTADELADQMKVSTKTINRMDRGEKLPKPIRFGTSRRWLVPEIEAWLAEGGPTRARWNVRRKEVTW